MMPKAENGYQERGKEMQWDTSAGAMPDNLGGFKMTGFPHVKMS